MFNMRIDIIRKELERRFKEIEKIIQATDSRIHFDQLCKITEPFIHFLISDPQIRPFVTGLTKYREKFLSSVNFKEIEKCVIEVVKDITSKIDEIGFFTAEFQSKLQQKQYLNVFGSIKSDKNNRYLTASEFYEALKDLGKYSSKALSASIYLDEIFTFIHQVINAGKDHVSNYPLGYFNSCYQHLSECKDRYAAFYDYQAEYEGADAAARLLALYMSSPFRHITNLGTKELGDLYEERDFSIRIGDQNCCRDDYKNDCETLYHAVDKHLMTGKSKNTLIERLKTYCMWIRREDFPEPDSKNKEDKISKIVTEFIFNHGYFPLVHFEMGRSIPDILYEPSNIVHWDNSVLIELKQYIGKSCSESQFKTDVGQARDYLSIVKGVKPDVADVVYLLVFYDGDKRFVLDKSFSEDNVQVEFIYVGEKTPSILKKEKILGAK